MGNREAREVKERFQSHVKSPTWRTPPAPRRLLQCLVTFFTALGLYYAFPQRRCLKRPLSTQALFLKFKKKVRIERAKQPQGLGMSPTAKSFLQCYWYSSSSIKFISRLTELTFGVLCQYSIQKLPSNRVAQSHAQILKSVCLDELITALLSIWEKTRVIGPAAKTKRTCSLASGWAAGTTKWAAGRPPWRPPPWPEKTSLLGSSSSWNVRKINSNSNQMEKAGSY